ATLSAGTHAITAVYGGKGDLAGSTSAALTQTVKQATAVALTSSVTSPVFGQAISLTAHVSLGAGAGVASGTVTFKDGATVLGTGTLKNGVAVRMTAKLKKGKHTLTAVYGGDADLTGSTSVSLTETIN